MLGLEYQIVRLSWAEARAERLTRYLCAGHVLKKSRGRRRRTTISFRWPCAGSIDMMGAYRGDGGRESRERVLMKIMVMRHRAL